MNHTQEQGVDVILDIVGGSYFQKKLKSIKNVMADLSLLALWEVELQKEFDLQKLIFKTCHNYRLNDASA